MKINILFEDENIIVCEKPPFVSSQKSDKDNMVTLLQNALSLIEEPYVVHRLDTAVSGLMVYAKNKKTAADLSEQIAKNEFKKTYLCIVHSKPENKSGTFEDLLFKDSKKNKSFVVKRERKGVKKAVLNYELIDTKTVNDKILSLVKVNLVTGRTHQIRVQFSSRKMPLYGDGKYGASDNSNMALFSSELSFKYKNENLTFSLLPRGLVWDNFIQERSL